MDGQKHQNSSVDIAVSTSDNEGMPIALIEAELAGIPVIATDAGSNSEVIIDGITGYLTKRNAEDIAMNIRKIIDKNLILEIGKSARVYAQNEFTLEKMRKSHVLAYQNIIKF